MSAYHRTAEAQRKARAARSAVALPTPCARCGGTIEVGQPFDLGHRVDVAMGGRDSELRPEHRTCNRRAGGRTTARVKVAKKAREVRPSW